MPITILVRSGVEAAEPPELTLEGARIVIGRGPGSDLRLPDPSVSARHATLRERGADYVLCDEGSTNGTWVGGVRLASQSPRLVRTGDLVRVGRVWLEVSMEAKPPTTDHALATRDLAFALVRRGLIAMGSSIAPRVRVVEGPDLGAELALHDEGRSYRVGRGEGCDLCLADPDASREHALVVARGGLVLLRDLSSRNGVMVGSERIPADREVTWRGPWMVRIGCSVLALDEPVKAAIAALEAAEDEPLEDDDTALPPPKPLGRVDALSEVDGPTGQPPAADGSPLAESAASPMPPHTKGVSDIVPRRRTTRAWSFHDVFVVSFAVFVLALSVAGLIWVLR